MPAALRVESGWYEEDCDWCLVVIAFSGDFLKKYGQDKWADIYNNAIRTMRDWHPERYEQYFNIELKPGESRIKDDRLFKERNHSNYIVIAAWSGTGSWHKEIPAGMVGVCAKRNSDEAEGYFLVPKSEYTIPFVVDESRHQRIKAIA